MSISAAAQKGPGKISRPFSRREQSQDFRIGIGTASLLEHDPLQMDDRASSEVGSILQPLVQAPLALRGVCCSCSLDSMRAMRFLRLSSRASKRASVLASSHGENRKSTIRCDLHQSLERTDHFLPPSSQKQICRTTGPASLHPAPCLHDSEKITASSQCSTS